MQWRYLHQRQGNQRTFSKPKTNHLEPCHQRREKKKGNKVCCNTCVNHGHYFSSLRIHILFWSIVWNPSESPKELALRIPDVVFFEIQHYKWIRSHFRRNVCHWKRRHGGSRSPRTAHSRRRQPKIALSEGSQTKDVVVSIEIVYEHGAHGIKDSASYTAWN